MKIIHVTVCDDTLGEAEGMFDQKGNLLAAWSRDDASWRSEYFAPLMKKLGIRVALGVPTPARVKKMKEFFGLS